MGILSTLHCKKLRLAVEEALGEHPGPLEGVDHKWVGGKLTLASQGGGGGGCGLGRE